MNATNDGGPAFPCEIGIPGYGDSKPLTMPSGEVLWIQTSTGMSLRDWFAGMALQGVTSSANWDGAISDVADDAYSLADAMLAARERKEDA